MYNCIRFFNSCEITNNLFVSSYLICLRTVFNHPYLINLIQYLINLCFNFHYQNKISMHLLNFKFKKFKNLKIFVLKN